MTWIKIRGDSGTGKTTIARNLCFELNNVENKKTKNDTKIINKYQGNYDYLLKNLNCKNAVYVHSEFEPNHFFCAGSDVNTEIASLLAISEYAPNLSQGEVQRFILLEALSLNPDLIILDEALTGLPEAYELEILKKLKILLPNLHLLYISHRNSMLIDAMFERTMEL